MVFLGEFDALPVDDTERRGALFFERLASDPLGMSRELRASRPVLATHLGPYVTRRRDVTEVLSTPGVFSSAFGGHGVEGVLGGPFMIARDGLDVHWRERGYGQLMLDPQDLPRVRRLTARICDTVLDEALATARAAGRSSIDLVQDYGRPVASRFSAEYFGMTGFDDTTLDELTRHAQLAGFLNLARDPGLQASGAEAGRQLCARARELIAARRSAGPPGPDDVLGRMLRTELPAELGMDDERLATNLVGWLATSQPNASAQASLALYELCSRPDVLASAENEARTDDGTGLDAYVREASRFRPFIRLVARLCVRDHVLAADTPHATPVSAGTVVFVSLLSAMHDEEEVREPEAFRTDRPFSEYLIYGYGPHECVGGYVADAVLSEMVRRVLLRPEIRPLSGPDGGVGYDDPHYPARYPASLGHPQEASQS